MAAMLTMEGETKVQALLEVQDLKTYFHLDEGVVKALDGVSFQVGRNTVLGIIGESGCGKSVTALSILRIVPRPGRIMHGTITYRRDGEVLDLTAADPKGELIRGVRGKEISMVFQEPMSALSPVHTIGSHIEEAILLHRKMDKTAARELALDLLGNVGIPDPARAMRAYSYQLSGGMRQRAMIAIALSCDPSLLIADEPTTALDVTVQAQIIDLLKKLKAQLGMSILYITHDLGVIAEMTDSVLVMYLGRIVEHSDMRSVLKTPLHPYTQRLIRSVPRIGRKARTRLDAIQGTVPVPLNPPWRCGFSGRCAQAIAGRCDVEVPALVEVAGGHRVRCFLHSDLAEPREV